MVHLRCLLFVVALLVLSLAVVACGSSSGGGETESASTYTPGQRVSANKASRSALLAAFELAQISYADKWAREVEEYRPHPEDDLDYRKLRGEPAKYNKSPGVVDEIGAQLELP